MVAALPEIRPRFGKTGQVIAGLVLRFTAAPWGCSLPRQAASASVQMQYGALQAKAQQLADAKEYQGAAAIYEQLLRTTPNSPQVLNNLGAAYAHLEKYDQA